VIPIRHGSVYTIPDTAVELPPTPRPLRKIKPTRPFLVYSNDVSNQDPTWLIVSGFPLTTSDEFATEFDVQLSAGQADLSSDCWVQVPLLQAISKEKLKRWVGQLDANTLEKITGQLLLYNQVITREAPSPG
jgi:mRNA-degrading endonuclease toxin of MazEF toxin-antitoxin module